MEANQNRDEETGRFISKREAQEKMWSRVVAVLVVVGIVVFVGAAAWMLISTVGK